MSFIFDIGMYDGEDTSYYLSLGYKVVAIEANPELVKTANVKFKNEISDGKLFILNKAIYNHPNQFVTLNISNENLGSSSVMPGSKAEKNSSKSFSVGTVTVADLIQDYGVPKYIKIDIEGADRLAVLNLTEKDRPRYVSFEAHNDIDELVRYLASIGYTKFKAINQCNFLSLTNQESLVLRLKLRILNYLGYKDPKYIRMGKYFFRTAHSSGPAPWESNGEWYDEKEFLDLWKSRSSNDRSYFWYDVHVC